MGWDRKKKGSKSGYFYLSIRSGSSVKKIYFGRTTAGREAAAAVERRRQARLAAKETARAERTAMAEADRLAADLGAWAVLLTAIWLIATGHHQHRGCWRRARRES